MIDLRGRGLSEGERYYIAEYEALVGDIAQLVKIIQVENIAIPLFVLGHSAGGILASIYAERHQDKLYGLISLSIALRPFIPAFEQSAIKLLSRYFPRLRLVPLKNQHFSRDELVVNQMNHDPLLANERESIKTFQQLLLAAEHLKTLMPRIKLPMLIVHGTGDKVSQHSGSEYYVAHVASEDKQLKRYEGHYHDLLNDKYNGFIVKDIIRWLNNRI